MAPNLRRSPPGPVRGQPRSYSRFSAARSGEASFCKNCFKRSFKAFKSSSPWAVVLASASAIAPSRAAAAPVFFRLMASSFPAPHKKRPTGAAQARYFSQARLPHPGPCAVFKGGCGRLKRYFRGTVKAGLIFRGRRVRFATQAPNLQPGFSLNVSLAHGGRDASTSDHLQVPVIRLKG